MTFGMRIRELRLAKKLTLRSLAERVGVGFTYLSKIENHKLDDGHGPSEKLIHKLAIELGGDEEELLLLAEKVPEPIRKRFSQRPEVFRAVADLNDEQMDQFLEQLGDKGQ